MTNVAFRLYNLSFASALVAVGLELLHEARADLLFLNNDAFTLALGALLNIAWIISSRASAVRADGTPRVLNFHLLSVVKVFQRDPELHCDARSNTLRLSAAPTKSCHKKFALTLQNRTC